LEHLQARRQSRPDEATAIEKAVAESNMPANRLMAIAYSRDGDQSFQMTLCGK
jgi:hypothetical protein